MRNSIFGDFDVEHQREHAETHRDATPLILDFSDRSEPGFLATVAGMPVGQITWTIRQDRRVYDEDVEHTDLKGDYNGYYSHVEALVVAGPFRRRGIARMLFEKFTDFADSRYGIVHGTGSGWDAGGFTADGAAFYAAVTGAAVEVSSRLTFD